MKYTWWDAPAKDYTIKVYSNFDTTIKNWDDMNNLYSNILYTDSLNEPSEFTGNPFNLGDMIDTWSDRP